MIEAVRVVVSWILRIDLPDTVTALLWIALFWLPVARILFVWIPRKIRQFRSVQASS